MICFDRKHAKNQVERDKRAAEKGSAIIWVFVVIALFVALTFTMSRGTRTGAQNIDRETAQLSANELINYTRMVREAVKTLRINGCDDASISFANNVYNLAAHIPDPGTAPGDNSCHVFHPNGGNLRYLSFDTIRTVEETKQAIFITANIEDVGTGTDDLVMVIDNLPNIVCEQINNKLYRTLSVYDADFGDLFETGEDITAANCADCVGKRAACAADSTNNINNFYTVLVTR